MSEYRDDSPEKKSSGCGLISAVRRNMWPRRTTSTGSLPSAVPSNKNATISRVPSTPNSRRRKDSSNEAGFFEPGSNGSSSKPEKQADRVIARPGPNHVKAQPPVYHQQNQGTRRTQEEPTAGRSGPNYLNKKGGPHPPIGISGELESMISDHQRNTGAGKFVRASSGNVMLYGNLGNLRKPGGTTAGSNPTSNNILDYLPKTKEEKSAPTTTNGTGAVNGKNTAKPSTGRGLEATSLCRAVSTRMDPETLKIMGNEDYKNGKFEEALALYEAAISIDPNKASYRSNKSAALTALGRLIEAVFECKEAIRIEPGYQRAHNRLATLYLRLGDPEKAMYHYKQAGAEADPDLISKAKKVQTHLSKCTQAKMQRDWNTLLKESGFAISAGADSAPQIYALKTEALLKMNRHHEAERTFENGPNFEVDESAKYFGPIGQASLLVVRAQVDLVAGRFDDAVVAAQQATRFDSNNKEASIVARRTRAVAIARSNGNEHFKAGRYSEACVAYGEGLENDPYNSILLCNRAACRSKLGQFDKAIEDCNTALNIRPSYTKARLRRADCNTKLGKWEASIKDYEVLLKESPEDEEVSQALKEAQAQLKSQRG